MNGDDYVSPKSQQKTSSLNDIHLLEIDGMEREPTINIQTSFKAKLESMKNQVKNQINSISFILKEKRNDENRNDLGSRLAGYEVVFNHIYYLVYKTTNF